MTTYHENEFDLRWKTLFTGESSLGWMHSGVAVFSDGHIVFESPGGYAFIVLNPDDGSFIRVPVQAAVLHGLLTDQKFGTDTLWICDPGRDSPAQLIQVDRQGALLRTVRRPGSKENDLTNWKPTSIGIVEVEGLHKGEIWIADGYGENLVHRVSPHGEFKTFDGSSSSLPFNCPHGITIDTRGVEAMVAVADRRNKRVVFLDLAGDFIKSVTSELLTFPSSLAVRGDLLLVTDLFGAILSIDLNDEVRVVISNSKMSETEGWPNQLSGDELVAPTVVDGVLNSPHGIAVSPGGTVFFTEWYLGGRTVQIL